MGAVASQITCLTTVYSSKKTSSLCVTGLCAGNSPETGEFPAQKTSNAKNVSIWWRHYGFCMESLGRREETPLIISIRDLRQLIDTIPGYFFPLGLFQCEQYLTWFMIWFITGSKTQVSITVDLSFGEYKYCYKQVCAPPDSIPIYQIWRVWTPRKQQATNSKFHSKIQIHTRVQF